MVGIIDACSLVALSRYYMSLEDSTVLNLFLTDKFRNGGILLLETVYNEARYMLQGIVESHLAFIKENKSFIIDDKDLMPLAPKRFDNALDRNFVVPMERKQLNEEQYYH